jgi:hypothetical protein
VGAGGAAVTTTAGRSLCPLPCPWPCPLPLSSTAGAGVAGTTVGAEAAAMLRAGGGAGAAAGIGVSDGAGTGAGVTGAGVSGVGATGAGGTKRWMTIAFDPTCTRAGAGVARWTTGAIATRSAGGLRRTRGRGSAGAWTMAGCATAGTRAKLGVWPLPGPAKRRGNAAAPATAPASNSPTTTPLVIPIMVPTPDAESITRTGYRQVGTRA